MNKPRPNADQYFRLKNDGWSYEDIADHYGKSPHSIRAGVSEWRRTLKQSERSKVIPLPHTPPETAPLSKPTRKSTRHLAIRTLTYKDTDEMVFWERYNGLKAQKRFLRIFFPFDKHFPFHDPDALSLSYAIMANLQPDIIFQGSDVFDFPSISRHEPDYELVNNPSFDDVLDNVQGHYQRDLDIQNDIAPDALKPFIFGNHDIRFTETALAGRNSKTLLSAFLNLIKHRDTVQYMGLTQELLLDTLFVKHDGGLGQNVAKNMVAKDNTIHHIAGHTHRPDYACHVSKRFTSHAMVVGCHCQLIPHYYTKRGKHTTNWSQSLGWCILDTVTGNAQMKQLHYYRDDTHLYAMNECDTYRVKLTG